MSRTLDLLSSPLADAAQTSTPNSVDDVAEYLSTLRATNAFLRQLLETLPIAVLVYDRLREQTVTANAKFLAMSQQSDVRGDFDPLTLIADEQTRDTVHEIICRGFSSTLEIRLALPNQQVFAQTAISHFGVDTCQAVLISFLSTTPVHRGVVDAEHNNSDNDLFTPRELEIVMLLMKGNTNDMIARASGLSVGTVKNYTSDIYRKLNVSRRTEAILRIKELRLDNLKV